MMARMTYYFAGRTWKLTVNVEPRSRHSHTLDGQLCVTRFGSAVATGGACFCAGSLGHPDGCCAKTAIRHRSAASHTWRTRQGFHIFSFPKWKRLTVSYYHTPTLVFFYHLAKPSSSSLSTLLHSCFNSDFWRWVIQSPVQGPIRVLLINRNFREQWRLCNKRPLCCGGYGRCRAFHWPTLGEMEHSVQRKRIDTHFVGRCGLGYRSSGFRSANLGRHGDVDRSHRDAAASADAMWSVATPPDNGKPFVDNGADHQICIRPVFFGIFLFYPQGRDVCPICGSGEGK